MKTKNNNDYDFEVVLPEAQGKLDRQFDSITKLQNFAKTIFVVSGIVMSLFSTIISVHANWFSSIMNIALSIITILTFVCLTLINSMNILPVSLKHALKPTWEIYSKVAYKNSKDGSYAILVHQYLEAIKQNEKILIKQYRRSKCVCIILAVLIIIIYLQSSMFSIY